MIQVFSQFLHTTKSTTKMSPKFLPILSLLIIGAYGAPQFGLPKPPSITPPLPKGAESIPLLGDALEWSQNIQDLLETMRKTFGKMGEIAVKDNPEVGARIVLKLNEQIAKAAQIAAEYTAKVATTGRIRRAADGGPETYDKMGGVMTESPGKIESDKKQLSPEAQKEMDAEYVEGLKKCKTRECKAQLKTYEDGKL